MKNQKKQKGSINYVFVISIGVAACISLWGLFSNQSLSAFSERAMNILKNHFSWLYLYVMLGFVLFCLVLIVCPYGGIRLGGENEKPEYSLFSWISMLFAAGMGIGLVFWGISEPLAHYVNPVAGVEGESAESVAFAMRSCFMHWGLHPWGCYAVIGLGMSFMQFKKGEPFLVSRLFIPLFGRKISDGVFGQFVDIFTTILTVVGIAASFGMGCLQISAGLSYLFGIPDSVITWFIIIAVVCAIYLYTAILGVDKGIKIISDFNMILFLLMMLLGLLVGPTRDVILNWMTGLKDYMVHFFPDSVGSYASKNASVWVNNWRVFYWAWWLSWAPFVGVFIARISKGRTLREFVIGVMLVPTLVSTIWFSVFGSMSIHAASLLSKAELTEALENSQTALFHVFAKYPLGLILSLVALVLLLTFFITSANSATFVLAMLTSKGDPEPRNYQKTIWGILLAVLSFTMILSGSISMVQTMSIVIAFPYMILMVLCCVSMVKAFHQEYKSMKKK